MSAIMSVQRNTGPAYGFALAALTCITMLQIPIPVLHSHHEFEDGVTLSEHLVERHSEGSHVEDFHWHFLLPCELVKHQGQEQDESTANYLATATIGHHPRSDISAEAHPQLESLAFQVPGAEEVSHASLSRRDSLLHPPPSRGRAMLCVMLC